MGGGHIILPAVVVVVGMIGADVVEVGSDGGTEGLFVTVSDGTSNLGLAAIKTISF